MSESLGEREKESLGGEGRGGGREGVVLGRESSWDAPLRALEECLSL